MHGPERAPRRRDPTRHPGGHGRRRISSPRTEHRRSRWSPAEVRRDDATPCLVEESTEGTRDALYGLGVPSSVRPPSRRVRRARLPHGSTSGVHDASLRLSASLAVSPVKSVMTVGLAAAPIDAKSATRATATSSANRGILEDRVRQGRAACAEVKEDEPRPEAGHVRPPLGANEESAGRVGNPHAVVLSAEATCRRVGAGHERACVERAEEAKGGLAARAMSGVLVHGDHPLFERPMVAFIALVDRDSNLVSRSSENKVRRPCIRAGTDATVPVARSRCAAAAATSSARGPPERGSDGVADRPYPRGAAGVSVDDHPHVVGRLVLGQHA